MFSEAVEAIALNPYVGYGVGTNEYVLMSLFPSGIISFFPFILFIHIFAIKYKPLYKLSMEKSIDKIILS